MERADGFFNSFFSTRRKAEILALRKTFCLKCQGEWNDALRTHVKTLFFGFVCLFNFGERNYRLFASVSREKKSQLENSFLLQMKINWTFAIVQLWISLLLSCIKQEREREIEMIINPVAPKWIGLQSTPTVLSSSRPLRVSLWII